MEDVLGFCRQVLLEREVHQSRSGLEMSPSELLAYFHGFPWLWDPTISALFYPALLAGTLAIVQKRLLLSSFLNLHEEFLTPS